MSRKVGGKVAATATATRPVANGGSSLSHLIAIALAGASFLVRCHRLGGGFAWDDRAALLSNPDVAAPFSIQLLRGLFARDFWGNDMASPDSHKSFRPLAVLSLRADVSLFGSALSSATPFRAHNLLLHSINTALVFSVGRAVNSLAGEAEGAAIASSTIAAPLVAAAVFSLHPVQTDAVSSIVGRADVLATTLFLLAVLLYLRTQAGRRSWVGVAGSIVLALAASLTKETAFASFGALVIAELFLQLREKRSFDLWSFLSASFVVTTAAAIFLQWRLSLNAGTVFPWSLFENQLPAIQPSSSRWLTIAYTHAVYLLLVLWPFGRLSYYHGFAEIRPVALALSFWREIALVLAVYSFVAVVAALAFKRRSTTALFILTALVIGPFLPASNVFVSVGAEVAERLLYLPMAGVALLAGLGLSYLLTNSAPGSKAIRFGSVAGIAVALVLYFLGSSSRGLDWQAERALFTSAVIAAPTNIKALANFATLLSSTPHTASRSVVHDWALSKHLSEVCVSLLPEVPLCWSNLARLAEKEQQYPPTDSRWQLPVPSAASSPSWTRFLRSLFQSQHTEEDDKLLIIALTAGFKNNSLVNPTTSRAANEGATPSAPFTGRARALEAYWRSVQGSADSSLPLPCEAAEGLAEIYLAIAKERIDGDLTAHTFSVGDSTTKDAPIQVPLPEWAIVAGSTLQLNWLRAIQGRGISLSPASFALLFLDGAMRLKCGSRQEAAKSAHQEHAAASSDFIVLPGGLHAADLRHHRGTAHAYLDDHPAAIAEFALEPAVMLRPQSASADASVRFVVSGCSGATDGDGAAVVAADGQVRLQTVADGVLGVPTSVPLSPAFILESLKSLARCDAAIGTTIKDISSSLPHDAASRQVASAANMISLSLGGLAEVLQKGLAAGDGEKEVDQGALALCQEILSAGQSDNCLTVMHSRSRSFLAFAIALQPRDNIYRSNAASLWLRGGDLEGALRHARAAVELAPEDPIALTNLGFLLEKQGDGQDQEALSLYSKALKLAPGIKQIQTNYENLKARLGNA